MIPVSLSLKNFLSYGENVPALDFTEFDVACLSGNNGHGKSAILDAITWALWGEARKAAGERSSSDGLLRLGTNNMQVEFEFDLGGDRFRILRKFQRNRQRSKLSTLDFQVLDESNHAYRSLTEKTARSTQEKINAILRMNYDTFINSAFILQGRADEFTKKTPHKRKEILAEILDLRRYDRLVELAKKRLSHAEKVQAALEGQLENIAGELAHKEEYAQALSRLESSLKDLEHSQTQETKILQSLEKQINELRARHERLRECNAQQQRIAHDIESLDTKISRQQEQVDACQTILGEQKHILECYAKFLALQNDMRIYKEKSHQQRTLENQQAHLEKAILHKHAEIEKSLGTSQGEYAQIRKELDEMQQLLDKGQYIETGFQELRTARKQDEQWEVARQRAGNLTVSLKALEKTIELRKKELSFRLKILDQTIETTQKLAAAQVPRAQELKRCQQEASRLEDLEKAWTRNQEAGAECRALVDQLKLRCKELQGKTQEAEEKLDLIRRSERPECPLCLSRLETSQKNDIERHFARDIQDFYHEHEQLKKALQQKEQKLDALRTQYKELETGIAALKSVRERELPDAERALDESRRAVKTLAELQQEKQALQRQIEEKEYALNERAQRQTLEEALHALAYDQEEHEALKRRITRLENFAIDFSKLEDARSKQQKLKSRISEIDEKIAGFRKCLETREYAREEEEQLQKIAAQIADIAYDKQAHDMIEEELHGLQNAPEQKARIEQAQKQLPDLTRSLDELLDEKRSQEEMLTHVEEHIQSLSQSIATLPAVESDLEASRRALQETGKKRDRLLEEKGTYTTKYEHCLDLEAHSEQKMCEKRQADKEYTLYKHLIKIFGKDGIQAHLIESAFPEIEDNANTILAKLTDNRTHIAIEPVRELQSGRAKESLDIKISDELGTRSYEMYSGGESFRVDFAIRLALSKLLARRAGTRLKTLVIDEGFGTQDEQGLDQLVEAINTISADFEKILVITHLESLKNAFPVRIEVVKHPESGSTFQIIH
ncbi:hypothetical protein CSB45_12760 [candidate division KSB3 bacterium]|uniref:Rad50/SbcC-type AAA domain-containing protein n=1 Tax=candidate division KSB3 bacterium TaxID=2044937 RepID=A0A2G6E2H2_9BACT|nr:MAG: hypothetical protein CSB45_12760 [candidate division KSB3 bacterium]PIE28784.1 MAG: hypothetical protein CSA57_12185 [candidate division KSB3 bacterium]